MDEEKLKILDVQWRSANTTVGFVAYDTGFDGQWNSVVGYRPPSEMEILYPVLVLSTEEGDAQYIAQHGAKLEWELAAILFPKLDITKHKYYTGDKK